MALGGVVMGGRWFEAWEEAPVEMDTTSANTVTLCYFDAQFHEVIFEKYAQYKFLDNTTQVTFHH